MSTDKHSGTSYVERVIKRIDTIQNTDPLYVCSTLKATMNSLETVLHVALISSKNLRFDEQNDF